MVVYKKTLLALIAFFFVFWFILPLLGGPLASPFIFWFTWPARQLGIFTHEMGHGLFTLLSGGRFLWFQMELNRGGVAITAGGLRFLTLLGGLLGPALLGALLLQASTRVTRLKPILAGLFLFFGLGTYYMVKPIFLADSAYPPLQQWSWFHLAGLVVPLLAMAALYVLSKRSDQVQRLALQLLGILMCYSGFSDTSYIFRYRILPGGGYSDVRVLASTFWTSVESVPFLLFFLTAIAVSLANFGLMYWGTLRALQSPPAKT